MTTRTIFFAGYVLVGIALLACELAGRRTARIAKFSDIVGAAKRRRFGWVALLLAWWWLGFHVLARSSALEP